LNEEKNLIPMLQLKFALATGDETNELS